VKAIKAWALVEDGSAVSLNAQLCIYRELKHAKMDNNDKFDGRFTIICVDVAPIKSKSGLKARKVL